MSRGCCEENDPRGIPAETDYSSSQTCLNATGIHVPLRGHTMSPAIRQRWHSCIYSQPIKAGRPTRFSDQVRCMAELILLPPDVSSHTTQSLNTWPLQAVSARSTGSRLSLKYAFLPRTIPDWNVLPYEVVDRSRIKKRSYHTSHLISLNSVRTDYAVKRPISPWLRQSDKNARPGLFWLIVAVANSVAS